MKIKQFGSKTFSFMVGEEPVDEDEEATLEIIFGDDNMPFSAMLDGIPINLDVTLINLQVRTDLQPKSKD
tara:strand:+ start:42 stop:251 length:210 start_codon:yes stop_codon:yes gene_type:complete